MAAAVRALAWLKVPAASRSPQNTVKNQKNFAAKINPPTIRVKDPLYRGKV